MIGDANVDWMDRVDAAGLDVLDIAATKAPSERRKICIRDSACMRCADT